MEFNNQYLTHAEYKALGGKLSESAFDLLEFEARKEVDRLTFGRLISLPTQIEEVKLCVFKLIGVINENKSTIKSESVDGYNITMLDKKELEKVITRTIESYLSECYLEDGTPYLYRG
jgi:hypothetical protein